MSELFFLALLFKHAIADLALQNQLKNINKLEYCGNGHTHYLHHGLLTLITSLLFVDIYLALVISIVDYVLHWHIDFFKHHIVRFFNITMKGSTWWWITSLDQILHYSTYFFLVYYFAI